MSARTKFIPSTETVSIGTVTIGTIHHTERGFESFGPRGEYLCTYETKTRARRALYDLHQESEVAHR